MFIKGVNLGGWLVLEKWIAGDMFLGTTAKDEHELYEQLSYEEISQRLQKHWDTFIQEKDILAIKQAGCTLMRLPVPYTLFGDVKGRIGCIEYVDTVFKWAEKYGVQILLDLHTVPGGQNALDNSGIMGLCTWHLKEENIRITLDVLEKLAQRYRNSQELFGIELLNEPVDEKMFKGIADGIEPEYKERILKSKPIEIGCIEYVDTVFKWAEKYGVQILLDLHTVPGGQNALDNSGIMGLCTWHLKEENIRITLDVLEKLAQRYRNSQELFGIELLNEPVDEKMFKGIADGIEPEYKERILKSKPIDTEFLVSFYQEAYELLSPILKSDQKIVIHDGFRLGEWSLYFPKRNYPKLWIDTHMYLNFARYSLKDQSCKSYVDYIFD